MIDTKSYILGKKAGGGPAPTPTYQDKEITITQNGEQTITADSGYDALSSVDITTNVPQPSGKIIITENDTDIDVSSYATADVNVPAGADLSEYFNNTIGSGTSSQPGWTKIIKKIPSLTATNPMNYVFKDYTGELTPIDLSNVSNMDSMFAICKKSIIDLSNWTFPSNKSISISMSSCFFDNAHIIQEVNLSSMGNLTSGDVNFSYMFQNVDTLKKVNLSNLELNNSNSIKCNYMFDGCSSLEELDMSKFDFTRITSGIGTMFRNTKTDCLIYVKDQTQKDWFTTNFPSLTNVQIKGA